MGLDYSEDYIRLDYTDVEFAENQYSKSVIFYCLGRFRRN